MHDTNQMETNSTHPEEEYVFPVPNTIEIYDLDRRRMDDYVHAFGAHQQGYRTRIGHSTAGSHVCHYDCYRGGYPRGGQAVVGTTRSLRIGCQFRLSARFLPNQMCWLLIHTHLKHNHPHDPNVKPRKKPPAPDPILPHPYHLNLDANLEDPSSFPLPSTSTSKPDDTAAPTPNPSTTLYQPSDEIITHLLQKTTNNLTKRLQSLTPHRRHEAIQKIEAILMDQESSTPPREQPSTVNPSPIVQDVINTYHQSPNTVSPNLFLPETEVMQSLMLTDHVTSPEQPIEELNDPSINSIIDDFFGTSEFTKSTFNIEDLLFADAPPAPTHCTPPSSSPLPLTTSITNVPLAATTGATAALVTERERREQQLQLPASLPSPTGRLTRNRTRELAQKAAFEKSVLKELLAKYSIHRWLEPFVLNIREVEADGHCGFRAIAVSLDRPQDDWPNIRQQLEDTLLQSPNIFSDLSLPDLRAEGLAHLRTRKANVVNEQKFWLTMPGWGGVIATTFNRPVIFYGPNHSDQITFPYLTPPNTSPPIVLALAFQHFCSLSLDLARPNLPVPKFCRIWQRFCSPEASHWLSNWSSLIDHHADYMASQNRT